ncbi:c-type cytochrome [Rubellimicrobium roseum]|uniref:C-type cytochrome n=1 Tax=Rubellimicrobium roseum TaxID=687525 RepID=A0A5C4NB36_9RHOB|nr:c-type cytochrome [Rubellimicrobium roseum]TNC63909.1 c-type cytochrome [Rubellimicrobium roseum]
MFDTMTLTKIVGGFCGSLLVFLLGGWVASGIYGGGEESHATAEGEHGEIHQAYVIPVEGGEGEAAEEVTPEQIAAEFQEAFAAADPAAGEGEFRPCSACHALEAGDNRTGPYLYGVVGRPIDAAEGYDYSGALEVLGEAWTPEALNVFLIDPQAAAPGTKMNYNGMKDVQDRANLIAYLDSLDG